MRNCPLYGLSANTLSIDMNDTYLDAYALSGFHAQDVVLFDFANAHVKPIVNRTGIGMKSFAGCKVDSICILSD